MTRDISGRRLFSLNDVFAIAGGLLAIATLIGAIMIVRQIQTLGIPFGYLNV